jgi:hypothetical protein
VDNKILIREGIKEVFCDVMLIGSLLGKNAPPLVRSLALLPLSEYCRGSSRENRYNFTRGKRTLGQIRALFVLIRRDEADWMRKGVERSYCEKPVSSMRNNVKRYSRIFRKSPDIVSMKTPVSVLNFAHMSSRSLSFRFWSTS